MLALDGAVAKPSMDTPSLMHALSLHESHGGLPVYVALARTCGKSETKERESDSESDDGKRAGKRNTDDVLAVLAAVANPSCFAAGHSALLDPVC